MDLAKLRSKMGTRKLAGVDIPRENRTSVAFRKAMSAGGGDHDGITGGSSHRLCRASGGRVKREGGGPATEDSKKEAERLRNEIPSGVRPTTVATGIGLGTMLAKSLPPKVRALGAVVTGAGALKVAKDAKDRHKNNVEADRIEKGQDRKCGGSVKKGGK
jgi:hypothetical protein